MESFRNDAGQRIVLDLVATIQKNTKYLSDIDGAIGDGDHGINMNKGFSLCGERLAGEKTDFSSSLATLGDVLLTEIGGSMGPLYGTFFGSMAEKSKGHETIDASVFCSMLEAALKDVQSLGDAKLGDKTMLDTLIPAVEANRRCVVAGKGFKACLAETVAAAERGMNSTKDLVAKVGRSSRLGERSRGVLDAGAVSCCLIICSMSESIIKLFLDSAP